MAKNDSGANNNENDFAQQNGEEDFSYFPNIQEMQQGGDSQVAIPQQSVASTKQTVMGRGPQVDASQKQQMLKQTKTRVKKASNVNPFNKHNIIRRSAVSKLNNMGVRRNYNDFLKSNEKKKRLSSNIQRANTLEQAQKGEKEFQKEEDQQKKVGRMLKVSMLEEDLKRALQGPAGWAKNLKGCFSSAMICLTIIGGSVLGIILSVVL